MRRATGGGRQGDLAVGGARRVVESRERLRDGRGLGFEPCYGLGVGGDGSASCFGHRAKFGDAGRDGGRLRARRLGGLRGRRMREAGVCERALRGKKFALGPAGGVALGGHGVCKARPALAHVVDAGRKVACAVRGRLGSSGQGVEFRRCGAQPRSRVGKVAGQRTLLALLLGGRAARLVKKSSGARKRVFGGPDCVGRARLAFLGFGRRVRKT